MIKNNLEDISLDKLHENLRLSSRAVKVCKESGLDSLYSILNFYATNYSFQRIENCGDVTERELMRLWNKYKDRFLSEEKKERISIPFDVSLESLSIKHNLSRRAYNVCHNTGLFSLSQILEYYIENHSFHFIRNCGSNSNNELISLCEKYLDNKLFVEVETVGDTISQSIESLSPFQKSTLNRHFEFLVSKLSIRAFNGLSKISNLQNSSEIFKKIFSLGFNFHSIQNIGVKTVEELEAFKLEISHFVEVLQTFDRTQLSKEYAKLFIKNSFKNLEEGHEEKFENIFDENGKIKLFALIKLLLESGQIFSQSENKIFSFCYNIDQIDKSSLESIASDLNLSRERVRQIKLEIEENIQDHFKFISNFRLEDLINYSFDSITFFKSIDTLYARKYNSIETVNFNAKFYSLILDIVLKKSFVELGNIYIKSKKEKSLPKIKLLNRYLIHHSLYEVFDFEKFISDFNYKNSERIPETYSIQFQGYLYDFFKANRKEKFELVQSICEEIIYLEFDSVVNHDGYILFERTTKKQVYEYCLEVLSEKGQPMTIEQIGNEIKIRFPEFDTNVDSLRSSLVKEKSLFIYFGRRSTYGLRKWEEEMNNIKGGTIRDLVEEYLLQESAPRHISDISKFVEKYRPNTYEKSVLDNLKAERNKRFKFYKKGFIGLLKSQNTDSCIVGLDSIKTWQMRYDELRDFIKSNESKMPSANSLDKTERALYLLGYKARKDYNNGTLAKEKEIMLREIGFPLEKYPNLENNWYTEAYKLEQFIYIHKRLPNARSSDKDERDLYRFYYFNKRKLEKGELESDKSEALKNIQVNFKSK